MKYSEKIYDSRKNIICTGSDLCFFNYPQYEIVGMDSILTGLTVDSPKVFIIEDDVDIPLEITFMDNLEFLNPEVKFNFNILPYNGNIKEFTTTGMYNHTPISYSGTTHSEVINTTSLLGEGEYVFKLSYQYRSCTEIASLLGKRQVATTYNNTLPYRHLDKTNDKYFVVLYKADEPILDVANNPDSGSGTTTDNQNQLQVTNLIAEEGVDTYTLNITTEGDLIVTLNGMVLTRDGDYTFSNNQLVFAESLKATDIVNYIFIGRDATNGLKYEILSIDEPIASGPTGSQTNNYIYYNSDTSKYEIYTEYGIKNPNSLMLTLKGVVLTNKVDYYVSSSDSRRIILEGEVFVGDWFSVLYDSGLNVDRTVTEGHLDVAWLVNRPIKSTNGEFVIEFSKTKTFDVIEQSEIVPYVVDKLSYTKRVTMNYPYGTILYYRIRNNKRYTTISGEILVSENLSDIVRVEIKTNISNNY